MSRTAELARCVQIDGSEVGIRRDGGGVTYAFPPIIINPTSLSGFELHLALKMMWTASACAARRVAGGQNRASRSVELVETAAGERRLTMVITVDGVGRVVEHEHHAFEHHLEVCSKTRNQASLGTIASAETMENALAETSRFEGEVGERKAEDRFLER